MSVLCIQCESCARYVHTCSPLLWVSPVLGCTAQTPRYYYFFFPNWKLMKSEMLNHKLILWKT